MDCGPRLPNLDLCLTALPLRSAPLRSAPLPSPPLPSPHLTSTQIKHVELDGLHVKLQIWDTAGQERFRTITVSYFKGAHGVALVYDVTDRDTFEAIRHWVKQIQEHAESNVTIVLIGNKCDKEQLRMVSREEGEELAKEINAPFFETSAKTNINVEDAFHKMAVMTKNSMMLQESNSRPSDGSLMIDDPNARLTGSGKGGCC